ncbi:MAG: HAMP domain-containing protein [Planctomycetota bacterium]|nr:MAG: HAMP domain-containing protein [Planctomycetota bacterium]
MLRPPRLFWLILFGELLAAGIALFGGRLIVRSREHRAAFEQLEEASRSILASAASEARDGIATRRFDRLDARFREAARHGSIRLRLITSDDRVVAGRLPGAPERIAVASYPEIVEARRRGAFAARARFDPGRGSRCLCAAQPVESNSNEPNASGTVVWVSIPIDDGAILPAPSVTAALLLLLVVVCVPTAWFISQKITRPLSHVSHALRRLADGAFDVQLPRRGPPELTAVFESVNDAADELERRFSAVRRNAEENAAILSSMVEGILAVDTRGCILRINEPCARLLRTAPRDALGKPVREVVRTPELVDLIERLLDRREADKVELRMENGRTQYYIAQGAVLSDSQERMIGVLVVLHDVTRLRYLEQVRRDFVSNVSHELRTPITSIKGFIETLLNGALEDREVAERFLAIVHRQVDRLNALITDLLSLARLERDEAKQNIRLEPGCVRDVVENALGMCRYAAEKHGVQLQIDGDGVQAMMNPRLLEQAVVNLVDNAIKYSPQGETVVVRFFRRDAEVVVEVVDHGTGIEKRHLPRLFERFYRVDPGRSAELGGTGLGLAIVKHVADVHGGRVEVESVVAEGSTFRIILPAAPHDGPSA